eukprot:4273774-Pyramimonas_sp.AAC.1
MVWCESCQATVIAERDDSSGFSCVPLASLLRRVVPLAVRCSSRLFSPQRPPLRRVPMEAARRWETSSRTPSREGEAVDYR